MIEVRGLRKSYGAVEAVRGIDLYLGAGEVFALLGPNGAGKTTTVEILEGHRTRSSGRVSVLGHDPATGGRAFKARIGIVLQERGIDPYLTVEELVELYRGYYPKPQPLEEILELVGLKDSRGVRVSRLSGGQMRRLDVAVGLAGDPELLFLDEPTTGFDPQARRGAWRMIEGLKALGKSVFLTTHYLEEAQHLADRVAILVEGRIVGEGSPQDLTSAGEAATEVRFRLPAAAPVLPGRLAERAERTERTWAISTREPVRVLNELTGWALAHGVELHDLTVRQPSLEEIYLKLTGPDGEET
ncbi:MAG: ABC transporter ATP-binding protein [Actinomycetota bacterium]